MPDGGWEISGTSDFAAAIDTLIAAVDSATRTAVVQGAALIEANAKMSFGPAHSKGTPKTVLDRPQSITGTLRRSIHLVDVVTLGTGVWQARVAPSTVYGRRIELGFKGPDSLGRMFPNSVPLPYLKPGVDKSIPMLQGLFQEAWQVAWRS